MTVRGEGVGEIIFARVGAGRQSIGARSRNGEIFPIGTEIVILSVRDGIATVEAWDTFMRQVRAGQTPLLEPLEQGS
jgi:hypothetical protein